MRPSDILQEALKTNLAKDAEYGDNYLRLGALLSTAFPNGLELSGPDDFNRFHLLLLCFVKITRYAENWDTGGHADSLRDLAVYAAMLEATDYNIKEEKLGHEDPFANRGVSGASTALWTSDHAARYDVDQ